MSWDELHKKLEEVKKILPNHSSYLTAIEEVFGSIDNFAFAWLESYIHDVLKYSSLSTSMDPFDEISANRFSKAQALSGMLQHVKQKYKELKS